MNVRVALWKIAEICGFQSWSTSTFCPVCSNNIWLTLKSPVCLSENISSFLQQSHLNNNFKSPFINNQPSKLAEEKADGSKWAPPEQKEICLTSKSNRFLHLRLPQPGMFVCENDTYASCSSSVPSRLFPTDRSNCYCLIKSIRLMETYTSLH